MGEKKSPPFKEEKKKGRNGRRRGERLPRQNKKMGSEKGVIWRKGDREGELPSRSRIPSSLRRAVANRRRASRHAPYRYRHVRDAGEREFPFPHPSAMLGAAGDEGSRWSRPAGAVGRAPEDRGRAAALRKRLVAAARPYYRPRTPLPLSTPTSATPFALPPVTLSSAP